MKPKTTLGLSIFFLGILMTACARNNDNGHVYNDDYDRYERYDREDRYRRGGSTVIIAKSDESVQCRPRSGLSLSAMARRQLPGVQILSSSKRRNRRQTPLACGYETGMMNVYEIYREDMGEALQAGFFILRS